MAIRSTFTTEPRIARLRWLGPACARYSIGSIPMEVANAASERRINETTELDSPVCFWLPAPSRQPCVHDQAPHIPGLLRLWTGIRLAGRGCANTVRRFPERPPGNESSSCTLKLARLILSPYRNLDSSHVSYLAQTRRPNTCHPYSSSECADGAATADSQLLCLGRRSRVLIRSRKAAASSESAFFIRVYAAKPCGQHDSALRFPKIEIRAIPPGG